MISEKTTLQAAEDIDIEAVVEWDLTPPRACIVMCHAHPRMGGTMNAPLFLALRDHLLRAGFSIVRFNFRGVGESSGRSGTGEQEVDDAVAALSEARRRWPSTPVVLLGWSFGGGVAVRTATRDASVAAIVTIAPAVADRPGVTAGLPSGGPDPKAPLLVIYGSNDDQVAPEDIRAWAGSIPGCVLQEIPGANHFFWARYDKLAQMIREWLDGVV